VFADCLHFCCVVADVGPIGALGRQDQRHFVGDVCASVLLLLLLLLPFTVCSRCLVFSSAL
jgi:hypothetical protein